MAFVNRRTGTINDVIDILNITERIAGRSGWIFQFENHSMTNPQHTIFMYSHFSSHTTFYDNTWIPGTFICWGCDNCYSRKWDLCSMWSVLDVGTAILFLNSVFNFHKYVNHNNSIWTMLKKIQNKRTLLIKQYL